LGEERIQKGKAPFLNIAGQVGGPDWKEAGVSGSPKGWGLTARGKDGLKGLTLEPGGEPEPAGCKKGGGGELKRGVQKSERGGKRALKKRKGGGWYGTLGDARCLGKGLAAQYDFKTRGVEN